MTPTHTESAPQASGHAADLDRRVRELADSDIAQVGSVLRTQLADHAAVLTGVHPDLRPVSAVLARAGNRGKRLRASFCLWGARGATRGELPPGATQIAAAVELFHLAALIHDDIMDHSDQRRGLSTMHRHFADEHRHNSRIGDADAYGEAVAVLAGDLCLTWSDDILAEGTADLDRTTRRQVRRIFSVMRDEAIAGQFLDVDGQTHAVTSATRAELVLRFKSAKYTISHPLRLGAAVAGAPADLLSAYDAIGIAAGEAFQLRDDLLGVLGDPAVTGKPTIDDIREGKRTLLIAWAEENADRIQRRVLDQHLGNPEVTHDGVREVCEVLRDTGAVRRVENRIAELAAQSTELIDASPVDEVTRHALAGLVARCVWRAA
ncbi:MULTISPECIES: polyprenyl synthetase family protein [Gordonia]|uniref:Polyprenyl synthetase family protein n=1 Tax=Gordonia tangerina TaxID=2911060 RepID=A0ABS9DJX3_9ACTN|nr:polyprenyl synthetase family protein [Gordonia tangerina]MCF3938296.1 polyprenyl synthetase family protein [Gordonia tangerina]